MGDMGGGGGVKNLKKVRDVLCERPLMKIVIDLSFGKYLYIKKYF